MVRIRPARIRLGAIAASLCLAFAAHAQTAARPIDLPAAPLERSLNTLARQAGVQILFAAPLAAGRSAPALKGDYTAQQALERLLAGTGLVLRRADERTFRIEDGGGRESTLSSVVVSASADRSGTTEGTGSYTQTGPSRTATGLTMSQRETPQSVSVLTRQRMDDENIHSLQDVANTVTGLSYTQTGSERPSFHSRGYGIGTFQQDGVASEMPSSFYAIETLSLDNMVLYDRVEVVRGANGLLQGTGSPSAAINMVRKRPTREFQASAQLGAGSWDNYSVQLDVSGPLTESGHLRGRAVAFYNDKRSFRDDLGKQNQLLYLTGELDITDRTLFTVGVTAQKDNSGGYAWGGIPKRADGTYYSVPRSTSLQGDWTYLDKTNYTLFAELAHDFSNGWKVVGKANYGWNKAKFLSGYADRHVGDTFSINYLYNDYKTETRAFNLSASGPFELFGRTHELMFGGNYGESDFYLLKQGYADLSWTDAVAVDIYAPDMSQVARPTFNNWLRSYSGSFVNPVSKGFYAATRLNLRDDLKLVIGGRVSDYSNASRGTVTQRENGVVTPYAGLVYDINKNHSLYASYTDIFQPQEIYGPGGRLAPLLGSNYEAGVKSEFWGGRLNTTLAIFQVDQENRAEEIQGHPRICGPAGTAACHRTIDEARNRGFEMEASGAITPDWQVSVGYTYSNPKGPNGNQLSKDLPRRLLKLSTAYRLPGELSAWRIGGNLHAQNATEDGTQRINGYALLNLRAAYQVNRNLDVSLNLNNAFDKTYYIPDLYMSYGEPRNTRLTLRYNF